MLRSTRQHRAAATACLMAAGLLAATGCTMCPDPLDYAGPVPNGTPPQNDFRARSNGILPLGAVARPWPEIVSTEAPESDEQGIPTLADLAPESLDVLGDDAPVVSVLVDGQDGVGTPDDPHPAPATPVVVADQADRLDRADRADPAPSTPEDIIAMLLPPQEQPPPATPPGRESPGWKRRR